MATMPSCCLMALYTPPHSLKTGVPGIPVFRFKENLVIQQICFTNTSTHSKEICGYKQSFAYLYGFLCFVHSFFMLTSWKLGNITLMLLNS